MVYCAFIGSKYGNISVDDVLFSSHTVSSHIGKLADEYRLKIREQLIEPLASQAVTICPDLWSDPFRQISYLGISVCFTNDKYQFINFDLCCCPYTESNKSAPNIIIVSPLIFVVHRILFLFIGYSKSS